MRVGVLGRTSMLSGAARAVAARGHAIAFVHTCPAEPHHGAAPADFAALAAEFDAPFFDTPRAADAVAHWRDSGAEAVLSVNWPTVLGREALEATRWGVLNAHAGDLPRYRGNACPNWAILEREPRIGLTIHRMSDELDAGPWLFKSHLEIDETTYIGDVYAWLERETPRAFAEALARLPDPGFIEQDPAVRPLRAFPRRPSDARIDWSAPTRTVLALIRASSHPFDGAFTTLEGGETVRIFRARRHDPPYDVLAVPGQVCIRVGGAPAVATGDGMVVIEECASEGRGGEETRSLLARSLRARLV